MDKKIQQEKKYFMKQIKMQQKIATNIFKNLNKNKRQYDQYFKAENQEF